MPDSKSTLGCPALDMKWTLSCNTQFLALRKLFDRAMSKEQWLTKDSDPTTTNKMTLLFVAVMDAELRKIATTGNVKMLESNLGVNKLKAQD